MNDLVLHPHTRATLKQFLTIVPHAIMLTGNKGSGKSHIAKILASEFLGQSTENHPYFLHLEPADKSFSIDQIRQLQKIMKLKTTGDKRVRRVAILQDVHKMTTEAQNALLKLLEEPPEDTVLILTAQGDTSLKPTIYSRVQRVHVKPVPVSELADEFKQVSDIDKLYSLSAGDMGLLTALVKNSSEHPLAAAIEDAKTLITEPAYKRLIKVDVLTKDKERLVNVIAALKRISSAALRSATLKHDSKNTNRWAKILDSSLEAERLLQTNTSTKLLLTELFLSF